MNTKSITLFACLLLLPLIVTAQEERPVAPGKFIITPDSPHGTLFILSETWADVREVTGELSRYCVQHYRDLSLKVNRYSMPYLSPVPVLYVEGFQDKTEAMRFFRELEERNPDFMQMNMITAVWPLSQENFYQVVYQESLKGYPGFFGENY